MNMPMFWQDDLEHLTVEQLAELAFKFQGFILLQKDMIDAQAEVIQELKHMIDLMKGLM
jgi:hypothetical protein